MNEERRKWKTQFAGNGRIHSKHGDRMRKTYGAVFDEKGSVRLEEKGQEDLYGYIQSFADSVDIHVILKRFANGETDVLSRVQGFYGDYTELPKDYAQMLNVVNGGEQLFNSLPVDVRSKFGHNFNTFMTALCDGSINEMLGAPPSSAEDSSPSPSPSPAE